MSLLAIYCLLVMLASLAGGWLRSLVVLTHRRMQIVLSAIGGFMLGIAVLHLLPHSGVHLNSIDQVARWTLAGIVIMFVLMRAFHTHSHGAAGIEGIGHTVDSKDSHFHSHGETCEAVHANQSISWVGTALGLSLHTLIDGAALAAAVVAEQEPGQTYALAGLGTFLAVALHKPLDSLSITSLMAAQGWAPAIRSRVNFAYSLACPVGAASFWFGIAEFSRHPNGVIGAALAFAAGVFLCVSLADLLPEVEYHSHDRIQLSVALLAGVLAAYGIGFIEPPHAHEAGSETRNEGQHEHHHEHNR